MTTYQRKLLHSHTKITLLLPLISRLKNIYEHFKVTLKRLQIIHEVTINDFRPYIDRKKKNEINT